MGLQQGGEAEPADHLLADAVHDQDGDIGAVRRRFDMDAERTLPKGRVDNHCNGACGRAGDVVLQYESQADV